MKTIRVRPILVPYNIQEIQPKDCIGKIFLNENNVATILNDLEDITKSNAYFKAIPQQLILISLEVGMIKVGDKCLVKWGVDISRKDLYEISTCTKIGVGGIHYFDEMSMCFGQHEIIDKIKKIVATQEQLSPELINQLITDYNNGGIKDFEIEMSDNYNDVNRLIDVEFPKLTNGFVTVVEKEPILYTEEEVLELLDKLLSIDCSFTKEDNSKCIIVEYKAFTLQEWFIQNKKK